MFESIWGQKEWKLYFGRLQALLNRACEKIRLLLFDGTKNWLASMFMLNTHTAILPQQISERILDICTYYLTATFTVHSALIFTNFLAFPQIEFYSLFHRDDIALSHDTVWTC